MADVDKKQPALLGGLAVAFMSLTAFLPLPFISGICCCLGSTAGGALATFLLVKNSPQPVKPGDGGFIGMMAGLIGGAIHFLLGSAITLFNGKAIAEAMAEAAAQMPQMTPELQQMFERMRDNPGLMIVILLAGTLIRAIFVAGFAALGGLLGVSLFEKRKGDAPPSPPPPLSQYPPQAYGRPAAPPPASYGSASESSSSAMPDFDSGGSSGSDSSSDSGRSSDSGSSGSPD